MGVPRRFRIRSIVAALFLILIVSGSAAAVKVRVIVDSAGIKATPEIGSQTLANLPLGTVLDVGAKQGEWYKVTTTKDGATITGYIHELLVEEIAEGEAASALPPGAPAVSQAEIIAGIELKLAESKELIRQERDLDKAADTLRPLLAKAFSIDDRTRQKQVACEIYLWLALSYSKRGDSYGALMEFLNMFSVDYATAKDATRNVYEPAVSRLIDQADKQARGLLVDYSLEISSEPKEASIRIDGKEIGLTPEVYRTPIPRFKLEIAKEGFKTYTQDVFLSEPSGIMKVALVSIGRHVLVSSVPVGAQVFLDGQDTGRTTDCELPYVPYGEHVLKLKKRGWADNEQKIAVVEGAGPQEIKTPLAAVDYSAGMKIGGAGTRLFKLPKAVAFDPDGNFYVADESDVKVKRYTREGRQQITWGDNGRELKFLKKPAGIAFDGRGNCYVTDAEAACVVRFTKDGKFIARWGKPGTRPEELMTPLGVAVDRNGDIYVADSGNNRIVKYSADGAVKKTWGKPGTGRGEFYTPTGVAVTPQNEVVVIDRVHAQKFNAEGEPSASWGKGGAGDGEFSRPLGLAVDAIGFIYVADTGNNRVQKFSPGGGLVAKWGAGGPADLQMIGPAAVAVSDRGSVLVVETENGRLLEFKAPAK